METPVSDADLAIARGDEAARVLGTPRVPHARIPGRWRVVAEREGAEITVMTQGFATSIQIKIGVTRDDLVLEVREQTADSERRTRSGEAIDVIVGDPAFDAAFHVEGAPADVVRAVLDEPVRSFIRAHRPCHLELLHGELWLRAEHLAVEAVEPAIHLVVTLAASLPETVRQAALARERVTDGGYRGATTALAISGRHQRARIELARLESLHGNGSVLIPLTMAITATAHLALTFTYLPLTQALLLLLLLPLSVVVGALLSLVPMFIGDVTGLTALRRRRKQRRFDRLEAATHDPPDDAT